MKQDIKVIYPGRFQPFGPHHFKVWEWLCERFGSENVYISTSNKVDERSPLNFEEKKQVINKFGITQVVCCKQPYRSEEIVSKFSPSTSVIFVYGEKDDGRISYTKSDGSPGYFQKYLGQKNLDPYSKAGYVLIAPHISLPNQRSTIDSTLLRELLPNLTEAEFRGLMGWYDSAIHKMFQDKFGDNIFKKIAEIRINENSITKTQILRLEQYIDKLFQKFGIDINFQNIYQGTHFYQRLNDPRNSSPITLDELRNLFKKISTKYGNQLSKENPDAEGVLKDISSDLNIPFIIKWDRINSELDLVPKTIMKKKEFSTSSKVFAVENFKNILSSGTYTKHLCHPYDDNQLTIGDLSHLLTDLFVDHENINHATIKFDGHNLQVTFKNGQILASRNKGTIVNPMTISQVREKFSDRPQLETSFVGAHQAIADRLLQFPKQFLTDIFQDGRTFLNFEILHPLARNIYDYGNVPILSLHSLITYDAAGNEISRRNIFPDFQGTVNGWEIRTTPKLELKRNIQINTFYQNQLRKFDSKDLVCKFPQLKKLIWDVGNNLISHINDKGDVNISIIRDIILKCKDLDTENKYHDSLNNLQELGNKINSVEGCVVYWRDKIYKFTGSFAICVPIFSIYNKHRYQG